MTDNTLTQPAARIRGLHEILADLADFTVASNGAKAISLYHELEDALRAQPSQRLETIRISLRAENVSYGELAELQSVAPYVEAGDTELLEASGVPEGYADELAAEAEHAARTMAPPVPDVTRNAGYTVRAVMPGHPAGNGLLASWWVAAESAADSQWVTWEAYALDGQQTGRLSYNAGHYFNRPDQACNKRGALADLAVRAGTMPGMAHLIAAEVMRYAGNILPPSITAEDRRMASRLRKWASR